VTVTARLLTDDDAEVSRRLGWEAFGAPSAPPTEPPPPIAGEGKAWYGAFVTDDAGTERLGARMLDRFFESWFGGRRVATAGIAGVTTAAEDRGRGLLSPLFTTLLTGARERGAVISTLFPTAPKIYRRFGYEVIGDLIEVEVPAASLAAVEPPAGGSVRRAVAEDVPAIRECYAAWAAAQNGPLSREGAALAADWDDLLTDFTGVTVALDDQGKLTGYALWDRGQGYGPGSSIRVEEVIAGTPDAYRALLRTLGSFGSVTPTIKITTSGFDPIRTLLPALDWAVIKRSPYMINVIDVAGAMNRRGFRYGYEAVLDFSVVDHFVEANNGSYRLRVAGGRGRCERSRPEPEQREFTARGLAALYAGALPMADLRATGLVSGGDPATDSLWDGAFGGPAVQIRNYF
jgi:predicted acetyltransferase